MSTTRLFYARAILRQMNWRTEPQYEQALIAVMTGEDSTAHWNPMDTTLPMPDATPYNSFGPSESFHVWNYPTAKVGLNATCRTLAQANMRPFASKMELAGRDVDALLLGFSQTPWGGVGDILPQTIAREWTSSKRHYEPDWHHLVSGPGVWPYQSNGKPMG